MIHCGRFTTNQITKILGIFQIVAAIIITATGIGIVTRFHQVHHDGDKDTTIAERYIDEPWQTKYGAAIWMGLVMAIAGAFGCFADVKPHKSKYIYGTIFINIIVIIAAVLLLIFSHDAISWFEACQYQYYSIHTHKPLAKDCTDEDKSAGSTMYWLVFVTDLLVIPITVAMLVLLGFSNSALMEEMCQGTCFRKMVYKAKGPDTHVSYKTKNTHEFNKEMPTSDSNSYNNPAVYC